jgi:integrase
VLASPFLAIFIIAIKTNALSDSTKIEAQKSIRWLFNSKSSDGLLLRQLFEDIPSPVPSNHDQIIEIASHFKSLSWINQVVGQENPKPRTNKNHGSTNNPRRLQPTRISTNEHFNTNKRQSIKIKNISGRTIFSHKQVSTRGLAPIEAGSIQTVLVAPPGAEYDIELEQRRLALYSEMEHQYLPGKWESLTQQEVILLRNEIRQLIDNDNIVGLLLVLSIAMARNIADLIAIPLIENNKHCNSIWLSDDLTTWGHPTYQPPSTFRPDKNNGKYLHRTNSNIILHLPSLIKERCLKFFKFSSGNCTLGEAISLNSSTAVKIAKEWLANFRHQSNNRRMTLSRIRDCALHSVLTETMDPALTTHLFWLDSGNTASIYYATYHSDKLQQEYSHTLVGMLGATPATALKEYYVGSKLLVKQEYVQHWINDWKKNVSSAKRLTHLEKLVEVHNQIVGYTVMMLMFVTGHRSVADPFENIMNFDESAATFIIADKMNGGKDDGRLVWLPETAVQQLKAYLTHLKALSTRLLSYDIQLSNSIKESPEGNGDLPLFFLLTKIRISNNQERPIPSRLTPSSLSKLLQLAVPLNWSRHYLSTRLRKNNIPVEYIDQQLDHLKKGQRFDGPYSVLSVEDIGIVLQPALEKILHFVGWSILTGIQSFPTKATPKIYPQHYWQIGSSERSARRIKNQSRMKGRLRQILKTFNDEELNKTGLTKLAAEIKSEFNTEVEQIKARALAYKFLTRRFVNAAQILRKYWSCTTQLSKDTSIFNLEHGVKLSHARFCHEVLRQWATELSDGDHSQVQWLALFISSAIFEGGLVQLRFINQLLSTKICPFYQLNNRVWFDFVDNSYKPHAIRRWIPDTFTTLIFIQLHNKFNDQSSIKNYSQVKKIITKKFNVRSFEKLLLIAKSLYHQQLPAYLAHYVTGKNQSASLPSNAWLRLMTGKHFQREDEDVQTIYDQTATLAPKNSFKSLSPIAYYNHSEGFEKGEILRKHFRVLLNNADTHGMTKQHLIVQLTQIYSEMNSSSSPLPPFLSVFMQWTISIASDGRIKVDLAISTVRSYFLSIGRHLATTTASYSSFNDLDEDDFSAIYIRILDSTTKNNRAANADLLESFHHYLHNVYDVPFVDFNIIEPNRKKTSVRPNLLLPQEYQFVRSALAGTNRSILILSFRAGMRGKEIRKLPVSGINVTKPHPDIMLTSKTKTPASIRKISLTNNITMAEASDLSKQTALCHENNLSTITDLISVTATQDLRDKIRSVTGDSSMVNYDLRHSSVTIAIIKHTLLPKDWPPYLHDNELKTAQNENHEVNPKSRRTLFKIAMQTGHSSPSTTLTSYMHLLDWSLHRELINKQCLEYALINKLSGIKTATLRKIRERTEASEFDDYILAKSLSSSSIPAPENIEEMLDHIESYSLDCQSLYTVLECLRLFSADVPATIIAEKIEIDIAIVQQWLERTESVNSNSGYHLTHLRNNQSWLIKKPSQGLKQLEHEACHAVENDVITYLCRLFTQKYQRRYDAVFFDTESELNDWIEGLCFYGIASHDMTVLIPSNHALSTDDSQRKIFLHSHRMIHFQLLSHTVSARSWSATKRPGLGIALNLASNSDKRTTVQTELNQLLYAACHLINSKEQHHI